MSTIIQSLERAQLRRVPNFGPGDRVKVHFQVVEGTRKRTQVFEGVVIKRQGHGARGAFTVRKQSFGVGGERTFPVHSPKIEKIEVPARGDVRRAKLYYLRDRVGKRARVREKRYTGPEQRVEPGLMFEDEVQGAVDVDGNAPDDVMLVDETVEVPETEVTTDAPAPAAEEAVADAPAAESDAEAPADAPSEADAADEAKAGGRSARNA